MQVSPSFLYSYVHVYFNKFTFEVSDRKRQLGAFSFHVRNYIFYYYTAMSLSYDYNLLDYALCNYVVYDYALLDYGLYNYEVYNYVLN